MIVLHNKTTIPRDGFSYYYLPPSRPEAAFTIIAGTSFNPAVQKLMAYRAMNPWLNLPADQASCEHEIRVYTFARLKSTVGLKYALDFFSAEASDDPEVAAWEEQLKKNAMSKPLLSPLAAVLGAADDYGVGVDILKDWLGDGGIPVAQELAQSRADVCEVCPLNQSANWLERMAASVAGMVKKHVELKNSMKLMVTNEAKLQTCAACRCVLECKVWVPWKYIISYMKPETKSKLDPQCWILSEQE